MIQTLMDTTNGSIFLWETRSKIQSIHSKSPTSKSPILSLTMGCNL